MKNGDGKTLRGSFNVETASNRRTRQIELLEWFNGHHERDAPADFPAVISFSKTGGIKEATWYRDGKIHRGGDLPASIQFDVEGRPIKFTWWQNGQIERPDGGRWNKDRPAMLLFQDHRLERLAAVSWWKDGECYKEIGTEKHFYPLLDRNWLPHPVPTVPNVPSLLFPPRRWP